MGCPNLQAVIEKEENDRPPLIFTDILRQNEDFRRSISENTITDSETNIIYHLFYGTPRL